MSPIKNIDDYSRLFFYFLWESGPGLADNFHFMRSYEAGLYKLTVLKVHPPFCRITAYATMPG